MPSSVVYRTDGLSGRFEPPVPHKQPPLIVEFVDGKAEVSDADLARLSHFFDANGFTLTPPPEPEPAAKPKAKAKPRAKAKM